MSHFIQQEERTATIYPFPTHRSILEKRYETKIAPKLTLSRNLVSFQSNKNIPFYGWFKYKEGFSHALVNYLIEILHPQSGVLLDPFSGSGSALFAARSLGWRTKGIEILPLGKYITKARLIAEQINPSEFCHTIDILLSFANFDAFYDSIYELRHIPITKGAFPDYEERQLVGYISYCNNHIKDGNIKTLCLFAGLCILEEISYTRKDGQYLRWDHRSGRSQGKKPFNKGNIPSFHEAISNKLRHIYSDLLNPKAPVSLFGEGDNYAIIGPEPEMMTDSCLNALPLMESNSIDLVLTSPPYANRYDYTRTYALELVYLGATDQEVKELRQSMLSCTVENKDKRERLGAYYVQIGREDDFKKIDAVFENQEALQEILSILESHRLEGNLNNDGISRMVRGYFYEMTFVIFELARLLKPGGVVAMVNDNVRYVGEEVPVDLILSDLASSFGLDVRNIWTLGSGKGNSSQQMGNHGRTELRKCVYIWEKRKEESGMIRDEATLLAETHRINYRLRSTFFYRKLKEYDTLAFPLLIASLFPVENLYSWDDRAQWGIGEDAFSYISQYPDLHLIEIFCHPKLLHEQPSLIAYYRNIAALSQKGVGYLVGVDVKKIESDKNNKIRLRDEQIFNLAKLFNEHSTLIVDSSIESFTKDELHGMLLISTGAQIDGSWRNAIGEEAEKLVQRLLVKEAKERNLIAALIPRIGIAAEVYDPTKIDAQVSHIEQYKGIILNNKTSLLFSPEPDVSLLGVDGRTVGVLEIKGGNDPAGALERYGAAKKTFEEARRGNAEVSTILIASCITTEVHARIQNDPVISAYYNLTEMLMEGSRAYNEFIEQVFLLLGNNAAN